MNKEHCEFCELVKKEIVETEEEKQNFIKIKNLHKILGLSIVNLNNEECIIESSIKTKWGQFFLENKLDIGHFNVIPDLTFTYKLTDYCEKQIEELASKDLRSQLDIANKKLERIKKYVAENLIYIDDCDDPDTILSIITEDDLEKIIGGE